MDELDPTRWQRLFAELEAGFDAAASAEVEAEVRERARGETARLTLVDRLHAALDTTVEIDALGADRLRGRLTGLGPDWLLVDADREVLVLLPAVLAIGGLSKLADTADRGEVFARLGVRHALRELARRRTPVVVTLVDGRALHGTFDRVGADFAELAEHPVGEARRAGSVRSVRTLPLTAIATVRSA